MNANKIAENKTIFLSIARENINREGIENLLSWLCESDFFSAPCSTKFHLAEKGGLCQHSLNVYKALIDLCAMCDISVIDNLETITIISLFHDICKTNFYKTELKPVKENNQWVQKQVYVIDDKLQLGHGEKSAIMLSKYINLSVTEALAIRWHMGAWGLSGKSSEFAINAAKDVSKFVTLLQCADIIAADIFEKRN